MTRTYYIIDSKGNMIDKIKYRSVEDRLHFHKVEALINWLNEDHDRKCKYRHFTIRNVMTIAEYKELNN